MSEARGSAARIGSAVLVLALAAWLGGKWWWGLSHVTTDNAQVEGRIVAVAPKVGGFVAAVKVADNQVVKAGDLLAQLDDRDYKARLAQAEAELELVLAAAARGPAAERAAQVAAARAARELAALDLAATRLVAPAAGVVAARSVEPGQLAAAGQPLMSVVAVDEVWVVANLKETEVRGVRPGAAAEIEVDAYPGLKVAGTVDSIAPATGARFSLLPPENATGNFTKVVQRVPVKIRVKQNADPAQLLRPGMSVYASISTR